MITLPNIKLRHTGTRLEWVVLGDAARPVSLRKPVSMVKRLREDQVGQLISAARHRYLGGFASYDQHIAALNDIVQQAPTSSVCLAALYGMTRTALKGIADLNHVEPSSNKFTNITRLHGACGWAPIS